MSDESVRVRYAPSPTGHPHIGNIRTALFNWLFARHTGGKFIVRIEDTDQLRKVNGALESILDSLRWLGIDWDEGPEVGGDYGPYFQSERRDLYQKYAQQLLESGHAYKCYCSVERLERMRSEMAERKESMRSYDRHCRELSERKRAELESGGISPVIRFKVPLAGQTSFRDLIRGDITFDNSELDDLVLLKSDGYPTYHLANIVDDRLMKITNVMRADEWLSSTPRHVLLYRAFDWEPPLFAHLPMILGPDKSKLSKRHGAASLIEYRDRGYLPEAMMNYLALLGWALDDKTEIFSKEELIRYFSIDHISKTAAIFNRDKLDWMNGVYIRNSGIEAPVAKVDFEAHIPVITTDLIKQLMELLDKHLPQEVNRPISREYVEQIWPLIRERINTLREAADNFNFFFVDELVYETDLLLDKKLTTDTAVIALEAALQSLTDLAADWDNIGRDAEKLADDAHLLEDVLRPLAAGLGLKAGELFKLLRVAVTGRSAAPPLFQTMAVLGRVRCMKRIKAAIGKLGLV
jgi:glutamyl-tRNA synthetase